MTLSERLVDNGIMFQQKVIVRFFDHNMKFSFVLHEFCIQIESGVVLINYYLMFVLDIPICGQQFEYDRKIFP